MLKYAALLFNTIALLIYQFFFAEGITVTQNIPSSAKPDTEFTVELTINKGAVSGFAKLQQDLPEGFSAVQDDNNGASFTFIPDTRSVKFIWMSLPSEKEFKIKYKIKVAAGISGDKEIAGKFSYVSDNVKQAIDIAPSIITIGEKVSQPIATPTTPTTTTTTTTNPTTTAANNTTTEPTNTNTTTPVATTTAPTTTSEPTNTNTTPPLATNTTATTEPTTTSDNTSNNSLTSQLLDKSATPANTDATSITCTRTIPATISDNFTVEILVNKGNVSGFAKLLETLPAGFTAVAGDLQGASFSFDGQTQKAKFVWVSMPSQTQFTVSYKVTVATGATGQQTIDGVFSYIENDETKKYILAPGTFTIGGSSQPVVTNTNTPDNTTNVNTATNTTNTNTNTNTTTNNTNPTNNTNTTDNTAKTLAANNSIPSPQGNVNYRVQIMALHNPVSADKLASRYNINAKINTEMAEGYTKYTTGAHNDYKQARDAREEMKNKGVAGPFVTAYNSGKRITVQEALMITSQKWYR